MWRMIACAVALLVGAEAHANKICVVDFSASVGETNEGKSALQRLRTIERSRQEQLDRMQTELQQQAADLQSRRALLTADKIASEESDLRAKQKRLQDTLAQFQGEFERTYEATLDDLDAKVRAIAEETAKANRCTILLDRAVVVYLSSDVTDISAALVARYNKAHPGG